MVINDSEPKVKVKAQLKLKHGLIQRFYGIQLMYTNAMF